MKYYSLLKTTGNEQLLNSSIDVLNLSNNDKKIIEKVRVYERGKSKPKFKTIGDLVESGYLSLLSVFSSLNLSYTDVSNLIENIENALARVGLKVKGSEFTIGDVRIQDLNLKKDKSKQFFEKNSRKFKVVDDIIMYGISKWMAFTNDRDIVDDIRQAIGRIGLKLEGSSLAVDKDDVFPLDNFSVPRGYDLWDGGKKKTKAEKNILALNELSKEELMSVEVDRLFKRSGLLNTLLELDLTTIEQLMEVDVDYLSEHLSSSQLLLLEERLAKFDIKLKGSKRTFENGELVKRDISKKIVLLENAPEKVDVLALEKEEQAAFLAKQIKDFGFAQFISQPLIDAGLNTIGDIVSSDISTLIKILGRADYIHLRKALDEYNLRAKKNLSQKPSKYYDKSRVKPLELQSISDEDKEKLLSSSLEDAGLTDWFSEKIRARFSGVQTLEDLTRLTQAQLSNAFGTGAPWAVNKFLKNYGLSLATERPKVDRLEAVDVANLPEEEQRAFLERDLRAIGVPSFLMQKLAQNGIITVGDLARARTIDVKKALNQERGNSHYRIVRVCLARFNLNEYNKKEIVPIVDYKTLSDEEKQVFLNRELAEIGIPKTAIEKLEDGLKLKTVGDLINAKIDNVKYVLNFNTYTYQQVRKILANYGVELKRSGRSVGTRTERESSKGKQPVARIKKVKPVKKSEREIIDEMLQEEEKKPLLERKIEWLRLSKTTTSHFKSKAGVQTVGELIQITSTDAFKILCKNLQMHKKVRSVLAENGLAFAQAKSKIQLEGLEFSKEEEEKKPAEERCLAYFGLSPRIVINMDKAGIKTLGDLASLNVSSASRIINHYYPYRKEMQEKLAEFGLSFAPKGKKKSIETTNQNIEDSESLVPQENSAGNVYKTVSSVSLESLAERLREKGVAVLYELDKSNFKEGSLELEEIKTILQEYKNWRIQTLILEGANTEFALRQNEAYINNEFSYVEDIIRYKQGKTSSGSYEKKKQAVATRLSEKLSKLINKFYKGEPESALLQDEKGIKTHFTEPWAMQIDYDAQMW